MPAYAQLIGNIDTFPGIEKAHGRYALPRAVSIFDIFHLNYITGQQCNSTTKCADFLKFLRCFQRSMLTDVAPILAMLFST